jgi:hypothetical protein
VLFDGDRPPVRQPPRLGEHTFEVLVEAGAPSATATQLAKPPPTSSSNERP